MPTRLSLVCHVRTEAQRLGRFAEDEAVDDKHLTPAATLAGRLGKTVRILCAPETRTRQTAEALGGPLEIIPALADFDCGAWRGQRLSDLQLSAPEALATWIADPEAVPHGGESVLQLCARIGAWLDGFREDGHFVVVTHPFVIRAAILHALTASPASFNMIDVEPLSVTDLRLNGRWRLRMAQER